MRVLDKEEFENFVKENYSHVDCSTEFCSTVHDMFDGHGYTFGEEDGLLFKLDINLSIGDDREFGEATQYDLEGVIDCIYSWLESMLEGAEDEEQEDSLNKIVDLLDCVYDQLMHVAQAI